MNAFVKSNRVCQQILGQRSSRTVVTALAEKSISTNKNDTGFDLSTITGSVLYETSDNVCLIGLNRPSKRNAVDHSTAKKLVRAFQQFDNDDSLDVAVLYGKGVQFCSGYDLAELAAGVDQSDFSEFSTFLRNNRPMGPSMMSLSKPLIGAISGHCVAGGLELALMCDMRCADETAVFGVFCRRFGVPLVDGGTVRLPKLIGLSRAMDMILTGRPIDAKTAFQWGLVNRISATGTTLGEAVKLARMIAKFPQRCLRADRRSAYYGAFDASSMTDAFRFEYENAKDIIGTESREGASAFAKGAGRGGAYLS